MRLLSGKILVDDAPPLAHVGGGGLSKFLQIGLRWPSRAAKYGFTTIPRSGQIIL